MNKTIGILGCGWLGLPLATVFLADGYAVHGSTTSEEKCIRLKKQGIESFLIQVSDEQIVGTISEFLKAIDVLIINIPPKLRSSNKESYVKKMELLHKAIKATTTKKIIFISSTSVYGKVDGEATEATMPIPETETGKQLLASETIFRKDGDLQATILRFGGLIGPDRHPVTLLSGKNGLSNGNSPINLIHIDDCIRIIKAIVESNWWNETFNAVYPHHPMKKDYYLREAVKRELPIPHYGTDISTNGKIITSYGLINVKKFRFKTSIVS